MRAFLRLVAIVFVFLLATVAWTALGGVMKSRTGQQSWSLEGRVHDLWGSPQVQQAPSLAFHWTTTSHEVRALKDERGQVVRDGRGDPVLVQDEVIETHERPARIDGTAVDTALSLDQRRKGLLWFSLYDVDFAGTWTYTHAESTPGSVSFQFPFPQGSGVFDDFRFQVDGVPVTDAVGDDGTGAWTVVPVQPGQTVTFAVSYRSRGMDTWTYQPHQGTGQIDAFHLRMTTDFADVDFPAYTLSPPPRSGGATAGRSTGPSPAWSRPTAWAC